MTLGEKIQLLRMEAGLSQEALAEQLSVSRQAISKWELDKATPEVKYIVAMSDLFGVTTDHLLKEEPQNSLDLQEPSPPAEEMGAGPSGPSDRERNALLVLRCGNLLTMSLMLLGYCLAASRFYYHYASVFVIIALLISHIPLDISLFLLRDSHPGPQTLRDLRRGIIRFAELAGFSVAYFFGFHEVVDDLLLSQVMGSGSISLFFLCCIGLGLLFWLAGWILWRLLSRKMRVIP